MKRSLSKIVVGVSLFFVWIGVASAENWFLASERGVCEPIAQLGANTPEALNRQLQNEGSYIEWIEAEEKEEFYEDGFSEGDIRVGLVHGQILMAFVRGRGQCEKFINQ